VESSGRNTLYFAYNLINYVGTVKNDVKFRTKRRTYLLSIYYQSLSIIFLSFIFDLVHSFSLVIIKHSYWVALN